MCDDGQQKINVVEHLSLKHTIIIAAMCLFVGFLTTWVALLNRRVNNHIDHLSKDIELLQNDIASLKDNMKAIDNGITKLGEDINEHFGNIYDRLPEPINK